MDKLTENQYLPDYTVTPGEVLSEYLDTYEMTQLELSDRLGVSKKMISEIINGKAPIMPDTALMLERVFSRPAHFWNNLERNYQEDKARLKESKRLINHLDWLKKIPVSHMIKLGWIKKSNKKTDQLEEVLRFFGIASPDQWQKVWEEHQVAYRQTQLRTTNDEAVSAWLRQGEVEANEIECEPFNKAKFKSILNEARKLTLESPDIFQPRLIDICASAGVAVVFVPDLPKTGVHGATRWIGNKAVIQLGLRLKTNDHLWFTFFHEAGHIIKHGRKEIFIEGNGMANEKEEEANEFARNKLISPANYRRFLSTFNNRHNLIEYFAAEEGIAAGIVVGRLQHDGIIPYTHGNKLKMTYCWK